MRARWCGRARCNRRRGTSPRSLGPPCYPHQDGSRRSRTGPTAQQASDSPRLRSPLAHCPGRTVRSFAPLWSDSRWRRSGSLLAWSPLRRARVLPRLAPPDRPTTPASEATPPAPLNNSQQSPGACEGHRRSRSLWWKSRGERAPRQTRAPDDSRKAVGRLIDAPTRPANCLALRDCPLDSSALMDLSSGRSRLEGVGAAAPGIAERKRKLHEVTHRCGYRERASRAIAGPRIHFREHEGVFCVPQRPGGGRSARRPKRPCSTPTPRFFDHFDGRRALGPLSAANIPLRGHDWEAVVANRAAGTGCPACWQAPRAVVQSIVAPDRSLAHRAPWLLAELHPTRNPGLDPETLGARSGRRVWWSCGSCGHEWRALVFSRSLGDGCPECARRRQRERGPRPVPRERSLAVRRPELVAELHPTRNPGIDPAALGAGSGLKAWWRCRLCGHEWAASVTNRTNGSGCPRCARSPRRRAGATGL